MNLPYQKELYELRKWIDNTNATLNTQFIHLPSEVQSVRQWISAIALGIQNDYPFYADTLPRIANTLFQANGMGAVFLNPAAFGELVVIIRHIDTEPIATPFWATVHDRIAHISASLYKDGHYASAAEKAVKEVEVRLREKFAELKPSVPVPSKVGDIIGALLSEKGIFKFCDTSDTSGKNYRRGICALFEGTMTAYRNPSAHENLKTEKREALEQIMLASQLMFVLDLQLIQ